MLLDVPRRVSLVCPKVAPAMPLGVPRGGIGSPWSGAIVTTWYLFRRRFRGGYPLRTGAAVYGISNDRYPGLADSDPDTPLKR